MNGDHTVFLFQAHCRMHAELHATLGALHTDLLAIDIEIDAFWQRYRIF